MQIERAVNEIGKEGEMPLVARYTLVLRNNDNEWTSLKRKMNYNVAVY